MLTFFTADLHISHGLLANVRGLDVNIHDELIIEGINKRVRVTDRLYILGDVGDIKSWLQQIVCKNLYLIMGNHDKASIGKLFKTVEDVAMVKIGKEKVFLSHYAHAYWPMSHRGSYHLYGHTHSKREDTLDILFPDRRSMDCGVDNAYKIIGEYVPFSETEIMALLGPRKGHDPLSFYHPDEAEYNNL